MLISFIQSIEEKQFIIKQSGTGQLFQIYLSECFNCHAELPGSKSHSSLFEINKAVLQIECCLSSDITLFLIKAINAKFTPVQSSVVLFVLQNSVK